MTIFGWSVIAVTCFVLLYVIVIASRIAYRSFIGYRLKQTMLRVSNKRSRLIALKMTHDHLEGMMNELDTADPDRKRDFFGLSLEPGGNP